MKNYNGPYFLSIKSKLEDVISLIKTHPYLIVKFFSCELPPPADASHFPGKTISQPARDMLMHFYTSLHGLNLFWTFDDESHQEDELFTVIGNYCEGYDISLPEDKYTWLCFAKIEFITPNLLLKDIEKFTPEYYKKGNFPPEISIGNKPILTENFIKCCIPIESSGGGIIFSLYEIEPEHYVVFATDIISDTFNISGFVDFSDYLDILVRSKGITKDRYEFFSINEGNTSHALTPENFAVSTGLFDEWWIPRSN